jgi:DNA repair protein RecO
MAELTLKGIILRKTNFGDNDVIFDVLTDEGSIVGFFARGARKMKSRFSGVLQLGQVVLIDYATGKNLNYPSEIGIDSTNLFSFYSKSISHMNLYTDILTISRTIAKDLEDRRIFEYIVESFHKVDSGDELTDVYNDFLSGILQVIGVDTGLKCYFTGEMINDREFYYHAETNRVISKPKRPKSIDVPLISFDKVFLKGFLKRLFLEHVSHKIKLKF